MLFRALSSRPSKRVFLPHLKAVVGKMGPRAAEFLSDIFGLPADQATAEDQVTFLISEMGPVSCSCSFASLGLARDLQGTQGE